MALRQSAVQIEGLLLTDGLNERSDPSGLDLVIVKKIVEVHGEKVSFHPNPEEGVTVVVQFPLKWKTVAVPLGERLVSGRSSSV